MLKHVENVKSILQKDDSEASKLDSEKRSPLHAAAFGGTPEIVGTYTPECLLTQCAIPNHYSLAGRPIFQLKLQFITPH